MVPIWGSNANHSMTKPMSQWHECPKKRTWSDRRRDTFDPCRLHPSPNLSPSNALCLSSLSLSLSLSLFSLFSLLSLSLSKHCYPLSIKSGNDVDIWGPLPRFLNLAKQHWISCAKTFSYCRRIHSYGSLAVTAIPTKQGKVDAKRKNTS